MFTIVVTRANDWDESYNVYAARDRYPTESGDGILAGNVTIQPWEDSARLTWTPPMSGTWYFAAEAVRWGQVGPLGRLTPT